MKRGMSCCGLGARLEGIIPFRRRFRRGFRELVFWRAGRRRISIDFSAADRG